MSPNDLLDLVDASGRVERPTDLQPWRVVRPVALVGTALALPKPLRGKVGEWVQMDLGELVYPEDGMLESFIGLADASDAAIVRYANTWGLLRLCLHGLPAQHEELIPEVLLGEPCDGPEGRELVEWWRYWARQAGALAGLTARLRDSRLGLADHWGVVWAPPPWLVATRWGTLRVTEAAHLDRLRQGLPHRPASLHSPAVPGWLTYRPQITPDDPQRLVWERYQVTAEVNRWLRYGGVNISLRWNARAPQIAYEGGGFLGALAVQLMLVFAGRGMQLCSNCGRPFAVTRRRNPSRRTWCEREECHKARHAYAQGRLRTRAAMTASSPEAS